MATTPLQDASNLIQAHPFSLLAIFFTLLLTSYTIYQRYLHPLARFPGPLLCSLTNFPKLWISIKDYVPERMVELHAQYGDVVRYGPNDLHFNQPEAVEGIYKRGWPKGDFYLGFEQKNTGLFSELNEAVHARRKRVFGRNFTPTSIREYEFIMDKRYAILRKQLDHFAETGETFDLRKQITYCIVDILGELAFSEAFGNQIDQDPEKIPPVSEFLYVCCVTGQVPALAPLTTWIRETLPPPAKILEGQLTIQRLAATNIKRRAEQPSDRPDILGKIVAAVGEENMPHEKIAAEAVTLVVGGTHTTGNTLHLLFANLARNPDYLKRAIKEIDESLPPLNPDQACYGFTGLEEKLPFVNLCIRENFRKDPVGTFNMPRTVPPQGATIGGVQIPGGTQVSMNIHAFHHNPSVWGSDHNVFNPDRWYEKRTEGLSSLVIPYSVGKRACVGHGLANANIIKMTTTLLRCYEFEFVNKEEEMVVVSHGDSDLRTPVMVKVSRRGEKFEG